MWLNFKFLYNAEFDVTFDKFDIFKFCITVLLEPIKHSEPTFTFPLIIAPVLIIVLSPIIAWWPIWQPEFSKTFLFITQPGDSIDLGPTITPSNILAEGEMYAVGWTSVNGRNFLIYCLKYLFLKFSFP